jgi:broad specificity phosphatase PhoE
MPTMGSLYLVRHGQASFGADDYDQLSDLGHRQARRLGEYFSARGMRFDAILVGTLRRHRQTLDAILEGMGGTPAETLAWPGLNEYDSLAVIEAIHPAPLEKPTTPEAYRHHFRLLRDGLTQWMNGVVTPRGMPSYEGFVAGVTSALDHVRTHHQGQSVLVVSSGGPISTAVGRVLQAPPETTIELNLRIRNTAVTEFAFTPKRHMLVTYNTLPHLDGPDHQGWVTYA